MPATAFLVAALALGADPVFDIKPAFTMKAAPARKAVPLADSAVLVQDGLSAGSGWCVACEDGKSLVLTNAHVCERSGVWVRVRHKGQTHKGFVVYSEGRHRGVDLAAVVVYAEVPAVPPADAEPKPGVELTRFGFPWHTQGRLLPRTTKLLGFRGGREPSGAVIVDAERGSESGESGAGVVAGDRLVGVHWGHRGWPGQEEAAMVALVDIRRFCKKVTGETKMFPKLAEQMAKPFETAMYGGPVQDPPPKRMPPPEECFQGQ